MRAGLRNEMGRDSGVRDLAIVSTLFVRGDAANGVAGISTGELLRIRENVLIVDMKFRGGVIDRARDFGANEGAG